MTVELYGKITNIDLNIQKTEKYPSRIACPSRFSDENSRGDDKK